MSTFEASTQYNDWKGTAALDEHGGGPKRIEDIFVATGKVDRDEEMLIGFEFYISEGYFFVRGFYHPNSPNSDLGGTQPTLRADFQRQIGPIRVKSVQVDMTEKEFLKYFKRFHVMVALGSFSLDGREFEITEEV
jgi:hypothetical protein